MMRSGVVVPASYSGMVHCISETVRVEGAPALFKGILPTLAKAGPASAIMFAVYEAVLAVAERVPV
jgi:hypothetical protein